MNVHVVRAVPRPSPVFDTYFRFAAERQRIYYRRLGGDLHLTSDPILAAHRFTNCFRAADRVSQYLIRYVIYEGTWTPADVIYRTILFKFFNKISTWENLVARLGQPPRWFMKPWVEKAIYVARAKGETLYSAAYVMPSPGNAKVKHTAHLALLDKITNDWSHFTSAKSLQEIYERLLGYESIGPFLAYQLAIDLNYGPLFDFDENEFVVPGPGARDGIRKCFTSLGDYSEADTIRWVCENADREFARLGLEPVRLFGRALHCIDAQNLFCECDKYARVAHPEVAGVSGRTKIKQVYRRDPKPMEKPFFPPKWGLVP